MLFHGPCALVATGSKIQAESITMPPPPLCKHLLLPTVSATDLRSSLMSCSALLRWGLSAGGSRGLWSGKASSSKNMITDDSVTTRPSISSTGRSPEGTCRPNSSSSSSSSSSRNTSQTTQSPHDHQSQAQAEALEAPVDPTAAAAAAAAGTLHRRLSHHTTINLKHRQKS